MGRKAVKNHRPFWNSVQYEPCLCVHNDLWKLSTTLLFFFSASEFRSGKCQHPTQMASTRLRRENQKCVFCLMFKRLAPSGATCNIETQLCRLLLRLKTNVPRRQHSYSVTDAVCTDPQFATRDRTDINYRQGPKCDSIRNRQNSWTTSASYIYISDKLHLFAAFWWGPR